MFECCVNIRIKGTRSLGFMWILNNFMMYFLVLGLLGKSAEKLRLLIIREQGVISKDADLAAAGMWKWVIYYITTVNI